MQFSADMEFVATGGCGIFSWRRNFFQKTMQKPMYFLSNSRTFCVIQDICRNVEINIKVLKTSASHWFSPV